MTGAIAALMGLMIAGPMLKRGIVLNLDFLLLPHAPLPNGFWALGPELPRRLPVMLPLTWLDPVVGSVAVGKAMAVASIAGAFIGATRLARQVGLPWRWAAGAIYALGPFATTRLAVGHLFVLAAMAVLPFAAPTLLRPTRDLRRTFSWAAALALTGFLGGVFAVVLVCVGAVGAARRGSAAVAVTIAAQAPWLVPGALVAIGGPQITGAAGFRPIADGPSGLLALAGGQGFWQSSYQVGWGGWVDALLGAAVLGLAWHGRRDLAATMPRLGVVASACLGFVAVTSAAALDPLSDFVFAVPGASIVRESHRLLPLYLLWAGPAATLGASRLAARATSRAPSGSERSRLGEGLSVAGLVVAVLMTSPGVWGAGGQLDTAPLPVGWVAVRDRVIDEPGPVLALPWFQYIDLAEAGDRRVLHPLPLWLGGDVLTSSDPRIPGATGLERNDPREGRAGGLVADSLGGEPIADRLVDLGVRWVAVLDGGGLVRGRSYGELHVEALAEDPGLRHVVDTAAIDLFEVVGWRGSVVADDGQAVSFDPVFGPFARLDSGGPAVYARAGSFGWMRGTSAASVDASGQVRLPAGSGWLWYWPAVLSVLALMASFVAIVANYWAISRD